MSKFDQFHVAGGQGLPYDCGESHVNKFEQVYAEMAMANGCFILGLCIY